MPGKKLNEAAEKLTGRSQRKSLMKELNESQLGRGIKGFQEYAEKMNQLDALMEKYSVPNSFGAVEMLDPKAREAMLKAMRETAEAGEEYLKNAMAAKDEGKIPDLKKGLPAVVDRLQGTLNRDMEALERSAPNVSRTLPEILGDARSNIVFLDKQKIENLGGAQNSRIPITFKGKEGKQYRGVFTKPTYARSADKLANDVMTEAANRVAGQKFKSLFSGMIGNYREKHRERLANASDAQILCEIHDEFTTKQWGLDLKEGAEEELGLGKLGDFGKRVLLDALDRFDKATDKDIGLFINSAILGMEEGARIDSRNSAMSSVASLLGRSSLIAKSVNMKFIDQDGQELEGTFMDYADGVDLAQGKDAMRAVNDNPFTGENSYKGLKQIADLQVLDYICGNVDRHAGNMLYKTDENGDVVGVQGIDNDSSFGRFADKDREHQTLPGADDLIIISASMSKKVLSLTPAMLKFSLRGRGLSEEELDFAAKRLTTLQESIRKGEAHYKEHPPKDKPYDSGYLRTVSDEEFKKLKINELFERDKINLFGLTYNTIQMDVNRAKDIGYEFDPKAREELQGKELSQVSAAGRGFTGTSLRSAIRGASELVEDKGRNFKIGDLTNGLHGSSDKWDQMEAAVRKVAKLEQELQENPNIPITQYNARLAEIDEAMEELRETNDGYLEKKMTERHAQDLDKLVGKNTYEKARINHAKKIREFVNAYKKPQALNKEDEKQMTDRDRMEIRLTDDAAELHDRARLFKMMKEIHQQNNLESPEKMMQEHAKKRAETLKEQDGVQQEPEENALNLGP